MPHQTTNVAVLGSTGSIGRSTLEVIEASGGRFRAVALSAHSNLELLERQAARLKPKWIVATDAGAASAHDWSAVCPPCQLLSGHQGVEHVVRSPDVDVLVAAIVGSAGLRGTWAALEAGKRVALANKETMVMAGPLVTKLAAESGAAIVPVDSEHSAVFQALQAGRREDVKRIVLTASGGPFRGHSSAQLAEVTVADALNHPTWEMGRKITIDSATMMNKALEIIEARWLFDVQPNQISVVIHPQSIVHSLVEFIDGSVVAQLSLPDMKLPIQYALTWPERLEATVAKLDWAGPLRLEFDPPDERQREALELGWEVARAGGTAGAVLNAANEAAVAEFLAGRLPFTDIVPACRDVLENHHFEPRPSLEQLLELDRWARQEVVSWACI